MRDLKIDPATGDLVLVNGDLVFVEGDEEILQSIRIRLQLFAGEWFLDNRLGVPYFETVLVKNPDLPAIQGLLRSVILDTVGMGSLTYYSQEWDHATRKLTVTFRGTTADGGTIDSTEGIGL